MSTRVLLATVLAILLAIAGLFTVGWERPPMDTVQYGYRGLGMEQVINPRTESIKRASLGIPEPQDPASESGPRASQEYTNVKVLGDLSAEQFDRIMLAVTEWVSPEQGCTYCHDDDGNFASDSKYTKIVSRRMFEMTRQINSSWSKHVAETGVTCYTCHRGKPVPDNIWFSEPADSAAGYAASMAHQNIAAESVGVTSLPVDFFQGYLKADKPDDIRVISQTALPVKGADVKDIKDTERTYGLMMHISQALGVNCSFCHNSRSFYDWGQSTKERVTAWHGIQMVRELNASYLTPLKDTFPQSRLGPTGDAPKLNCATCHNGESKPLYGQSMLKDNPELAKK